MKHFSTILQLLKLRKVFTGVKIMLGDQHMKLLAMLQSHDIYVQLQARWQHCVDQQKCFFVARSKVECCTVQ
jgi:hypothetical protein